MAILMRALQDLSAHGVATTTLTYSDAHIAICLAVASRRVRAPI